MRALRFVHKHALVLSLVLLAVAVAGAGVLARDDRPLSSIWAAALASLGILSETEVRSRELIVEGPFAFHDIRSPNVAGLGPGEGVVVGAELVVPSGDANGDGFADSDGVSLPTTAKADYECVAGRPLVFNPNPRFKNLFSRFTGASGRPCDLSGPWKLTFENAGQSKTVMTPALYDEARVPLVHTLWLRQTSPAPEFRWELPVNSPHDAVVFRLYDLEQRNEGKYARIVFTEKLPREQSSFAVPEGRVQPAHRYAAAVELRAMREGRIVSRSRALFDFALAAEPLIFDGLLLPIVDSDGGAPGIALARYVAEVAPARALWIDLPAASSVVYASAPDSPRIRSLALPAKAPHGLLVRHAHGPAEGLVLLPGETLTLPEGGIAELTLARHGALPGLDSRKVASMPLALGFASKGRLAATVSGPIVPAAWTKGCQALLSTRAPRTGSAGASQVAASEAGKALACGIDVEG